ncbi:MAG: sigma-70 family RNA polymerase sigma factor [Polyangiaceae bacterium]
MRACELAQRSGSATRQRSGSATGRGGSATGRGGSAIWSTAAARGKLGPVDDYELLDAWRAGNAKAGNELFDRHFDTLYGFLRNKTSGDAADLVQSAFLACVESRDSFRGDSSFRTFLFAVARKQLYKHYRDRKPGADFGVTSLADLGPSPSRLIDRRGGDRLLLEALRSIPLELQLALELHYWEQLPGPEIARVLDIPEGTVRSRLRRAKEALEVKLKQLSGSPRELEASLANLEKWAAGVREDAGLAADDET